MWLSETEIEILELFSSNIYLEVSINELSKKLKKHYRVVRVNILSLIKKDVLKSKDYLGAKLISLNLDEPLTLSYISYVEEVSGYNFANKRISNLKNLIKEGNKIDSSFVMGVVNSKKSKSELFIISNKKSEFETLVNKFGFEKDFNYNHRIFSDFKDKELLETKKIIKGAQIFYASIIGGFEKWKPNHLAKKHR